VSHTLNDRTTALAAIIQSAVLVQKLASSGHVANHDLETAVHSLFEQNPDNISDVYRDLTFLETGLTHLRDIMRRNNVPHGNDIVRYVMGMIHLQKKLMKRSDMLEVIGSRIKQAQIQAEHFDMTHDNVIASLADIYTNTISTFSFRIQVSGDYNYLQQKRIGNQIRVLLFAGIRSAVLWRQLGGNRLQIIINRKIIIETTENLLKQAKQQRH